MSKNQTHLHTCPNGPVQHSKEVGVGVSCDPAEKQARVEQQLNIKKKTSEKDCTFSLFLSHIRNVELGFAEQFLSVSVPHDVEGHQWYTDLLLYSRASVTSKRMATPVNKYVS